MMHSFSEGKGFSGAGEERLAEVRPNQARLRERPLRVCH